jgi:hypothetical protein
MMVLSLSCILLYFSLPVLAEVRETANLRDMEREWTSGTLVCFDLDNTLIRAEQMLGSDQWWDDLAAGFVAAGMTEKEATDKAYDIWLPLQKISRFIPVQPDGPSVVRGFQDRGAPVMGLTARPSRYSSLSSVQLASIGIDFRRRAPRGEPLNLRLKDAAHYENGILFVGEHNSKGEALKAFLDATGLKPGKIVFADDKKKHVEAMEKVFGRSPVAYVGFRYGGADEWVKRYNRTIVEIQKKYMERIMPDDVAVRLK